MGNINLVKCHCKPFFVYGYRGTGVLVGYNVYLSYDKTALAPYCNQSATLVAPLCVGTYRLKLYL